MSYLHTDKYQEDEFGLNQEMFLGRQDSFGGANQIHQNTTAANQLFDFPEIELSDCESIAMSLELDKDDFMPLNCLSRKSSKNLFEKALDMAAAAADHDLVVKAVSEKNTELENSFNSCKANFCDDSCSVNKQLISEADTVIAGSGKNLLDPVLLRRMSSIQKKQEREQLRLTKAIKKEKSLKSSIASKRRRRRRQKKKLRSLRKVMLKKCSTNILQTFCMEFDDVFKLYPSLMTDKRQRLSTFPQVFNKLENFCVESTKKATTASGAKGGSSGRSAGTLSTMAAEETQSFTDLKSTLVRSKVSVLKGSMLSFEVTNNLREMIEISKCVKWERRLKYRQELERRGSSEDFSNSNEDEGEYSD